jgi:hypothetical protein
MKLLYCLIPVFLLLSVGCPPKSARFQSDAVNFASNDNKIDEKEYNSLVELIKTSDDEDFKKLFTATNGEIDNSKTVEYLLKLFSAKKLSLTRKDIWQPDQRPDVTAKFNIDVYIENSASMDGYIQGVTDFETAIYNLLGNFKTSDYCNDLNLNYINKQVTFTKNQALPQDIQDFIERLEPSTFKQRGGERGISDLQKILQTVIAKVDEKNAAVLVSDFVFSPGKEKNAQEYLTAQGVGINIDFVEKMKKFDLAAIVIQLQSKFEGNYYDKNNKQIPLNTKRPYYIWIFGSSSQIKTILDKKTLENIKGGYLNRIIFTPLKEAISPEYKILLRPQIGEFKLESGAKGEITDASISRENQTKGLFGFTLVANFAGGMRDLSYFSDAANYRLSNSKYSLTVEPITEADDSLKGFTHKLKLQTTELRDETLKIDVVGKVPTWVENSTSIDDVEIAVNDAEKQKTFGLKYLIEGVSDAFYPKSSENIINTINISIRK